MVQCRPDVGLLCVALLPAIVAGRDFFNYYMNANMNRKMRCEIEMDFELELKIETKPNAEILIKPKGNRAE